MLGQLFLPLLALLSLPQASASPVEHSISRRLSLQAIAPLSQTQRNEVKTFAQFASAAYCSSASVTNWACGGESFALEFWQHFPSHEADSTRLDVPFESSAACDANAGVTHIDSGGDDNLIPGWYIVYSMPLNAIVVGHQGTNTMSLISILEDAAFIPLPLNPLLFPGTAARGVLAHDGFMATQALTAERILASVKHGTVMFGTNNVTTVGHSLGAAMATLDALYLKLQLPTLNVKNRVYASPRVGNTAFSTYFAETVPDSTYVNNKNDPVPHLPPIFFGFEHVPGEVYIPSTDSISSCPGTENLNCILGASILQLEPKDHDGPYEGVVLGSCAV